MNDTRPMGLVLDMPAEQYHAIEAMSSSGLRTLARSPWHYKHRQPMTPTKPMLQGTLAHCAQLEPHALADRYIVVPDGAPRRPTKAQLGAKNPSPESQAAIAWWASFHATAAGREIVSAEDYATTQAQLAAIKADTTLRELFATGYSEASVFWVDEQTGIYCKARPDWVHYIDGKTVTLVDLKSTVDESPSGFGRASARMGYHLQAAHYVEGFQQATRLDVRQFIFAAVTSAAPILAVPYALTDEIEAQGFDERRELMDRYAWCVANDQWPHYGEGIQMLDFPAYAKRSQEVEFSYAD